MLPPPPVPPPPSLFVGATIVKKFPGYGVHRGTVAEIDGGNPSRTTTTTRPCARN